MKSESKQGYSVSINDDKADEKLAEIMASKMTLADYENKSFKSVLPQCIGTFVASGFNLIVGLGLAYTGILIPAIESPNSDIKVTTTESSLIASITTLVIALTSLTCGPVMDRIGRLNCIKISIIPITVGWVLIALAKSTTMLLIGRVFVGISGGKPKMIY
ncbi:facilitated trehalose transporter Tret1-like [Agrilus planipennis]|uniref:Facilitated trehalose transporter Tret1-like n=1 Tax=Agrilus planipennis TaxID=224129 RepID=A0A7F5RFA3_AGRPL|nr:facilitated trehalose transporter Tret1-like [Agrilus planipennis]